MKYLYMSLLWVCVVHGDSLLVQATNQAKLYLDQKKPGTVSAQLVDVYKRAVRTGRAADGASVRSAYTNASAQAVIAFKSLCTTLATDLAALVRVSPVFNAADQVVQSYEKYVLDTARSVFGDSAAAVVALYYYPVAAVSIVPLYLAELQRVISLRPLTTALVVQAESVAQVVGRYGVVGVGQYVDKDSLQHAVGGMLVDFMLLVADDMVLHIDFAQSKQSEVEKIYESVASSMDRASTYGVAGAERVAQAKSKADQYRQYKKLYSDACDQVRRKQYADAQQKFHTISDVFDERMCKNNVLLQEADVAVATAQDKITSYVAKAMRPDVACAFVLSDEVRPLFVAARDQYVLAQSKYSLLDTQFADQQKRSTAAQVFGQVVAVYNSLLDAHVKRVSIDTSLAGALPDDLDPIFHAYDALLQMYAHVDEIVQLTGVRTYVPFYPAGTYRQMAYTYIGVMYKNKGMAVETIDTLLAWKCYAYAARYGQSFEDRVYALQNELPNLLTEAAAMRKSALGRVAADWLADVHDGYSSKALREWQRVLDLYGFMYQLTADGVVAKEYAATIEQCAQAYEKNVPALGYPQLLVARLYQQAKQLYSAVQSPDAARMDTLLQGVLGRIAALVNDIKAKAVEAMRKHAYDDAYVYFEQILFYTAQQFGDGDFILTDAKTISSATQAAIADLYAQRAAYADEQKLYAQAVVYYEKARLAYQFLQNVVKDSELKPKYFLARTLATAAGIEQLVQSSNPAEIASLTVPLQYLLTEYTQGISSSLLVMGDPDKTARRMALAERLSDDGLLYSTYYPQGARIAASDDINKKLNAAERDVDAYMEYSKRAVGYTISFDLRPTGTYLVERNKMIPATQGFFTSAPTALQYYYNALLLYRPGADLVSFAGKTYVPGQQRDAAFDQAKHIAYALLSDVIGHYEQMTILIKNPDRSMSVLDQMQKLFEQIRILCQNAHDYLNGKDVSSQDPSPYETEADQVLIFMDQVCAQWGDFATACVAGALDPAVPFAAAQQAYGVLKKNVIDRESARGNTNVYTSDAVCSILGKLLALYGQMIAWYKKSGAALKAVHYLAGQEQLCLDAQKNGVKKLGSYVVQDVLDAVDEMMSVLYMSAGLDAVDMYNTQYASDAYNKVRTKIASGGALTVEENELDSAVHNALLEGCMYFQQAADRAERLFDATIGGYDASMKKILHSADLFKLPVMGTTPAAQVKSLLFQKTTDLKNYSLANVYDPDYQILIYIQKKDVLTAMRDIYTHFVTEQSDMRGFNKAYDESGGIAHMVLLNRCAMRFYDVLTQVYFKAFMPGKKVEDARIELASLIAGRVRELSGFIPW